MSLSGSRELLEDARHDDELFAEMLDHAFAGERRALEALLQRLGYGCSIADLTSALDELVDEDERWEEGLSADHEGWDPYLLRAALDAL